MTEEQGGRSEEGTLELEGEEAFIRYPRLLFNLLNSFDLSSSHLKGRNKTIHRIICGTVVDFLSLLHNLNQQNLNLGREHPVKVPAGNKAQCTFASYSLLIIYCSGIKMKTELARELPV